MDAQEKLRSLGGMVLPEGGDVPRGMRVALVAEYSFGHHPASVCVLGPDVDRLSDEFMAAARAALRECVEGRRGVSVRAR
jgi:hypothetical protein